MIFIEGLNGSGKTSLIEALYYACYLRSFRTRTGKEIIRFGSPHFFIGITLTTDHHEEERIEVGFEENEKRVKKNEKSIGSFKELITHYRIVSICGDDLMLVQGSPEGRRSFVDQSLFLDYPEFMANLKTYKSILGQRNRLLATSYHNDSRLKEQLAIWSRQLWDSTRVVQQQRIAYMEELEKNIAFLIDSYFSTYSSPFSLSFSYQAKSRSDTETFDEFWNRAQSSLIDDEIKMRRSLFGAHLDDISIILRTKQARIYASRGQQKLVVFLLKCAHVLILKNHGKASCMILDDFLTDFDPHVIMQCLNLLSSLDVQCFITSPLPSFFSSYNLPFSSQTVIL